MCTCIYPGHTAIFGYSDFGFVEYKSVLIMNENKAKSCYIL